MKFFNRILSALSLFFIVGIILLGSGAAQANVSLTDLARVDGTSVSVTSEYGGYNRRTGQFLHNVTVTNTSTDILTGPVYLAISSITPTEVTVANADEASTEGIPTFVLSASSLAPGESFSKGVLFNNSSRVRFSFTTAVYVPAQLEPLAISITSPETLVTVANSPIQVSGTINDSGGILTVNGATVSHSNGAFSTAVSLKEGQNVIIARAVNAQGDDVTDSISVSLDTTPPFITIDSPLDGSTVTTSSIAVSGLINDIVSGTVNENQASVTVNGVQASVANRSYLAQSIPLVEGENEINVHAADAAGNTAQKMIKVTFALPELKHIEHISGTNQSAQINSLLPLPLKVKLLDSDGVAPAPNQNVVFRVIQGDGVVAPGTLDESQAALVTSDADGLAQITFKLGTRSGTGNHKVRARAVGFDGEVVFYASADAKLGDKVSINSGNNQRGAINQPLPLPFIVAVTDEGANVVEGTQVEFKVTKGGGAFQNDQETIVATTDSDGRASAHVSLGPDVGLDVHRVTATLLGTTLNAGFTASGFETGDPGQTSITGLVFDNQDTPMPGVTISIDGTALQTVTDEQGQFVITQAPVGPIHLVANGSTTTMPGEWPTLSFEIVTVAGAENPLPAPIYMVKLDMDNAVMAGAQDVSLTLPEVPGFKLTVLANSATFTDGSREGLISVTPVNASKVPMPPPNGMQPQFIVTIQPAGTTFDPPAPLTLPNVDGHLPGAQVEMYSYDHDLESFVAIGLGTVSADGTVIESNNGIGVIKAGWHCGSQPSGSGCTHNCPDCGWCDNSCNCQPVELSVAQITVTEGEVVLLESGGTTLSFQGSATQDHCEGIKYEWDFGDASSSQGESVSHKYTSAGKYSVKLKVSCSNCTTALAEKTLDVYVVKLELESFTFNSDHGLLLDNNSDWSASGSPYGEAEWTPSHSFPITHTKNEKIDVTLALKVLPDTLPSTSFDIMSDGVGHYEFKKTINIGGGMLDISLTSAGELPNKVSEIAADTLKWNVKKGSQLEEFAQTNLNSIYVSYSMPQGHSPTEYRVKNVVSWANDAITIDDVAIGVWDYLTNNEPPIFLLGHADPAQCPALSDIWVMMDGVEGECIDLAKLMLAATDMAGVTGNVGYIYATTDNVNFSLSAVDFETRSFNNGGNVRTEYLRYFAGGGFNNWEAIAEINSRYYAVKETHDTDSVKMIKTIIGANDPATGNYQCWRYSSPTGWKCNTVDQYPAPLP